MKRIIALITVFVFAVALAGMVSADTRSPAEKLESGRAYLKLLDNKIINHRKLGNTAVVEDLQAQKKNTITRMKVWKAEAEAGEGIVAPPPPPVVVRPIAAPSAGLFGLGLNTVVAGSYVSSGNGMLGARGDLILDDPLALGAIIGLSEKDVTYHVGLGVVYGDGLRALPLYVDGVLDLPADLLGGIASYIGGGLNYTLYGNGATTGNYGAEVFCGIKGDVGLGLGGDSTLELGYYWTRSNTLSKKGIGLAVGQEIVL